MCEPEQICLTKNRYDDNDDDDNGIPKRIELLTISLLVRCLIINIQLYPHFKLPPCMNKYINTNADADADADADVDADHDDDNYFICF